MLSKFQFHRNSIITGHIDSFCLVCESHLRCEEDTLSHIDKPVHLKNLDATPYFEKYKDELVRKVKRGYFCELCNLLIATAAKIGLHVVEPLHINNKGIQSLRRIGNAISAFKDIYINEKAWHGLIEDTCALCNEEFLNEQLHKTQASHILNLVQIKVEFGTGEAIFRRIDDTSFQCLTCNQIFSTDTLTSHFTHQDHLKGLLECRKLIPLEKGQNGENAKKTKPTQPETLEGKPTTKSQLEPKPKTVETAPKTKSHPKTAETRPITETEPETSETDEEDIEIDSELVEKAKLALNCFLGTETFPLKDPSYENKIRMMEEARASKTSDKTTTGKKTNNTAKDLKNKDKTTIQKSEKSANAKKNDVNYFLELNNSKTNPTEKNKDGKEKIKEDSLDTATSKKDTGSFLNADSAKKENGSFLEAAGAKKDDSFSDTVSVKTVIQAKQTLEHNKLFVTNGTKLTKAENKDKILENILDIQKNFIAIDFEIETVYCKKCFDKLSLDYPEINNHIIAHKDTPKNFEITTPILDQNNKKIELKNTKSDPKLDQNHNVKLKRQIIDLTSGELGSNHALVRYMPITGNDAGIQTEAPKEEIPETNDPVVFAKLHKLTYNKGNFDAYCRICHVKLPSHLKSLKQHVYGGKHKKALQIHERNLIENNRLTNRKRFKHFLDDLIEITRMGVDTVVVNERYCITRFSFFMVTEQLGRYRCQVCELNLHKDDVQQHADTERHIEFMDEVPVVLNLDKEFVREIRPGLFHCGYCNLIAGDFDNLNRHLVCDDHRQNKNDAAASLKQHMPDIIAHRRRQESMIMRMVFARFGMGCGVF